jgi:hypothetical protein
MKKNLILVVLASLLVVAGAEAKMRPYGAAGCGLGSLVFKNNNNTVSQVLAGTTNGTFYSQTFGITSGTSNCTDGGLVAKAKEIPMFIETNQVALANDIARGKGETLANLSKVMGCSDDHRLGTTLQKNYSGIFTTENIKSARVTGSIINTVKGDAELAGQCKNVVI